MPRPRVNVCGKGNTALAIFAHADDMEFLAAGTLLHLHDHGFSIHTTVMSRGNCGSTEVSPAIIARIRHKEASDAAHLLGASFTCLDQDDLNIFYDKKTIGKVMELIRRVNPQLVFTHAPVDYMVDHEVTSRLVQTACFGALAPNYKTGVRPAARHTSFIPHLYYAAPIGGRNILGIPIRSSLFVNTSDVFERQMEMLGCHKSQRKWLRAHLGMDNYMEFLRQRSKEQGREARVAFAEGFCQHLGSGFPADNKLSTILGNLIIKNKKF